ncbi:hypothetical protein [uncultured Bradyrhizobium sp.]|uniref:hypothetical protein n=1 Tax=uncultured Bradyrhizobium sp. TaxID=199684 RepID=UPI00261F98D7|nr:hypothetical protein [uncultured Bradyrhizobium sp.]
MSKRPREAAIENGSEIAAALTAVVAQIAAMDDVTLAIYIQSTEKMLAAAKQAQSQRLSKVFLPPGAPPVDRR